MNSASWHAVLAEGEERTATQTRPCEVIAGGDPMPPSETEPSYGANHPCVAWSNLANRIDESVDVRRTTAITPARIAGA